MGLFGGAEKAGPPEWIRKPTREVLGRTEDLISHMTKVGAPNVGMYAGMTNPTRTGVNQLTDFSNGAMGGVAGSIANSSKAATAAGSGYGGAATGLWGQYGNGGASGAIQANTAGFMNDPLLQQQIDAATGDVARAFGEGDVLRANEAAGSGMARSTRAGVEAAIGKRGAMDRAGQMAAGMRSDAYARAQQLSADAYSTDANLAFQAAGGLSEAARLGSGLAGDAIRTAGGNAGLNLQAGDILQQEQQRKLDETRGMWREQSGGYQLDLMKEWMGLINGSGAGANYGQAGAGGGGSKVAGAAGGALSGAAAGAPLGPWGMAGGAILGGVSGYFGS